jgi:alpha-galactosidase
MTCHVSAVPNHQTGRSASMEFRGHVAMSGNLGYELDLGALGPGEKAEVARQLAFYKRMRGLAQFGSFHRLKSPFEGDEAAWIFVSPDRARAWALCFRLRGEANGPLGLLKLRGLDPEADYDVEASGCAAPRSGTYGGDELMGSGLCVDWGTGDARSASIALERRA